MWMEQLYQKINRRIFGGMYYKNVFNTKHSHDCLVLYVSAPFFNKQINDYHQNVRQVICIAKILDELGYNVDVADYTIKKLFTNTTYDLVFDVHIKEKNVYDSHLKNDAIVIAYITGSNPEFANRAERKRIAELKNRKGVKLMPRRQAPLFPTRIEQCDSVIFIGDEYNFKTYRCKEFRTSR